MAVTATKTVRDIVTAALRKANITGFGENPAAEDADEAMRDLNVMLKGWQNRGYNIWAKAGMTVTLTTAASYALTPARPLRLLSARLKRSGTEIPMIPLVRDEYDRLPNKAATGTPTQFYYDRQKEAGTLFVWPVLAAASGETVEITYERELEDIASLNDSIDVPGEWWDAVIHSLAARMAESLGLSTAGILAARAAEAVQLALAFDHEGSVFIGVSEY